MGMSQALLDFQEALGTARALLDLEAKHYIDPPPYADRLAVQGLRGGAAVLMVAALEQFLRQAFEEHLSRLEASPKSIHWRSLAARTQTHNAHTSFKLAMEGSLHRPKKERYDRIADIEWAALRLVGGRIDPSAFSETGGNPNAERTKAMFKALDINDVLARITTRFQSSWGSPIASTFVADNLNEIVNRRHRVAHTASALSISRLDLAQAVRFLDILVPLLDAELDQFVTRLLHTPSA